MSTNRLNENLSYDIDAMIDFIFSEEARDSNVEITENQVVDENGKLLTTDKVIHEVKSIDSNKCTIKYDMIKLFVEFMNNAEFDQETTPMTLGERMILNAMIDRGLIKEYNNKDK